MNENDYSLALSSFGKLMWSDDIKDLAVDLSEIPADMLFEDGSILDSLPAIKIVVASVRTARRFVDRYELKKQLVFLQHLQEGTAKQEEIERRKRAYDNAEKWFYNEVERICVYLNKLADIKKAKVLAEIYVDLVNQAITNEDYQEYLDVIDRLFMCDLDVLLCQYKAEISEDDRKRNREDESWRPRCDRAKCNRLSSIGLLEPLHELRYGANPPSLFQITSQGRYIAEVILRLGMFN